MARHRLRSFRFNAAHVAFILCGVAAVSVWAANPPVRPELDPDFLAGNWKAVLARLDSAAPQNVVERFIFAHACLAVNRNNEAVDLFLSQTDSGATGAWIDWSRNLASTNPENAVAHYFYGDALSRSGQIEDGIHEFEKGLATNPKDALLLNARGVAHAALGDVRAAQRDFDAASNSRPDLADAYANLGSLGIQKKRGSKGAFDAFEESLKLSPSFAIPLVGEGLLRTNGWPGSNPSPSYTAKEQLADARANFDGAMRGSDVLRAVVAERVSEAVSAAEKEEQTRVTTALSTGDPGTLIQRNLEALNNGGTKMGTAIENLMGLAVRFPDRTQEISSNIASVKGDAGSAVEQYRLVTSHREAMENLASSALSRPATDVPRGLGQGNLLDHLNFPATRSTYNFGRTAGAGFGGGGGGAWSSVPNTADLFDRANAFSNTASDLLKMSAAKPFGSRTGGNNRLGGLIPGFDRAGYLFQIGSAVANDAPTISEGRFNLFSSHLLDQSASVGLQMWTDNLSKAGTTFKGIDKWIGPAIPLAEAVGTHLGSGRIDPDTAWNYGDAAGKAIPLISRELTGSRFFTEPLGRGLGALSAGLPDAAALLQSRLDGGGLFNHPPTLYDEERLRDLMWSSAFGAAGSRVLPSPLIPLAGEVGRNTAHFLSDLTIPLAAAWELPGLNNRLRAIGAPTVSLGELSTQMRAISPSPNRPEVDVASTTTHQAYRIETNAGVTKITDLDTTGLAARSIVLNQIHTQDAGPGGFKTTTVKPLWEDGRWSFSPWYGLGYPISPASNSLAKQ